MCPIYGQQTPTNKTTCEANFIIMPTIVAHVAACETNMIVYIATINYTHLLQ